MHTFVMPEIGCFASLSTTKHSLYESNQTFTVCERGECEITERILTRGKVNQTKCIVREYLRKRWKNSNKNTFDRFVSNFDVYCET